jgi:hypothetical protein
MADEHPYPYGDPDWETVGRWRHLEESEDGPIWMLNLMKYRPLAAYRDGRESGLTGREADDAYAPLGPLAAVGATVALFADVTEQLAGEPAWDRVAVVRYPTRAVFFELQAREDFQRQHVHKEAGMEFTIVAGCLPEAVADDPPTGGSLVLGDRRRWDEARLDRVDDAVLGSLATDCVDEEVTVVLDPTIDALLGSVTSAPEAG